MSEFQPLTQLGGFYEWSSVANGRITAFRHSLEHMGI
jgi:hypothetical protein